MPQREDDAKLKLGHYQLEKAAADARKREGNVRGGKGGGEVGGKLSPTSRAREKVGKAVGMSGTTYHRLPECRRPTHAKWNLSR